MNFIKHTIRGCGNLPMCGDHPGTGVVLILVLGGFIAGLQRGSIWFGLVGLGVSALIIGPFYLWGAYERSVYDAKLMRKEK